MSGPLRDDPVWRQALDWRRRLHDSPGDRGLRAAHADWLMADAAHAEAYERLERVWHGTGGLSPVHARPARRRAPRRLTVAAAALAACLALLVLPQAWIGLRADHRTGTGQPGQVALSDGSVAHLDAVSAIGLDFRDDRRAVTLLQGQAFFEVSPDPARPFTVTADGVTVTVVGTAFDVRRGKGAVSVAVRSGVVTVAVAGAETRLSPGDRLVVDTDDGTWTTQPVAPTLVAPWLGGRLVVDGATIAEVVDEIRRYYPGLIVLRDDKLAGRQVAGVYDLRDPLAALRAVVHPHGGTVRGWPYVAIIDHP